MQTCDLNKGIIIEVYRNIYQNEIVYENVKV